MALNQGNQEQEMQKLALEANYYRSRGEELQSQLATINALVQDNASTMQSLESISDKNDSLFSIGSGVFVKAKPSSQKVFAEVGAKVIAEKTVEEAKALLAQRKEELIKAASRLQEELEKINAAINSLSERAEKIRQ